MLQSLPATSSFRLFLAALALGLWAGVVLGHGLPTSGPLNQARVLTFEDVPYKLADNTKGRTTLEIVEYENGGHYVKFLDTATEVPLGSLEWLSKITGPGWTNELRAALRLEIERGPPAFQRLFTENVSLDLKLKSVHSWNILKNTGLKTDVKWLEKLSDLKKAGFELIEEGAGVKILRQGDEIAKIADDVLQVKIPHGNGWAKQVNTPDALKILDDVTKSKKVYKIGTLDVSETTGAQYWSPENPLSFQKIEDYAEKYGLPVERLKGDNKFIIVGEIGQGELLITRPAVPYGGSKGGGIEIVTPSGAVKMESFHILKVD